MQTVAHRLAQYYVDFCVELPPTKHLNNPIKIVLFYDLSHQIDVLHFGSTVPIHHTVDFAATCAGCEDGVEAICTLSEVKDCFACEKMLVFHDDLMVGLMG
jgi:hypothetical protein